MPSRKKNKGKARRKAKAAGGGVPSTGQPRESEAPESEAPPTTQTPREMMEIQMLREKAEQGQSKMDNEIALKQKLQRKIEQRKQEKAREEEREREERHPHSRPLDISELEMRLEQGRPREERLERECLELMKQEGSLRRKLQLKGYTVSEGIDSEHSIVGRYKGPTNCLEGGKKAYWDGGHGTKTVELDKMIVRTECLELEKQRLGRDIAELAGLLTASECRHGAPNLLPGHIVSHFIADFLVAWRKRGGSDKGCDANDLRQILASTCKKYPTVWEDDTLRERVRKCIVSVGVDALLRMHAAERRHAVEIPSQGPGCGAVLFLEHYHPLLGVDDINILLPQVDLKHMRNRDAVEGCGASITRFFSKRSPCDCLKRISAAAKVLPRTGLCMCCGQRKARDSLLLCKCASVQYCSELCRMKDLDQHKADCKRAQTRRRTVQRKPSANEEQIFLDRLRWLSTSTPDSVQKVTAIIEEKCPYALVWDDLGNVRGIRSERITPAVFWNTMEAVEAYIYRIRSGLTTA